MFTPSATCRSASTTAREVTQKVSDQNRKTERIQHELKFRIAAVVASEQVTPRIRRITLHSPAFEGFVSPGYDDHVRLFFAPEGAELALPEPGPNGLRFPGDVRPEGRDYTPRSFDPERNELVIDFVIHGDGPASNWARDAVAGDTVGVGGPRASFLVRESYDWYLLVGDETAMPAIWRRLRELREAPALAFIEVRDADEKRALDIPPGADVRWILRHGLAAAHDARLLHSVRVSELPPGRCYAFVAGEAELAKAIRRHLVEERGFDAADVKASGYWRRGERNHYDGHEH